MSNTAQVAVVVPHTHWDREWYAPFETMRFHLVRFLDELIDVLENDPNLPAFLLDGQSVIIEDYLEIRRDQGERVRALVSSGRLRIGPFYVQPDEFHVSGEAIVRNLVLGCAVAERHGRTMREGYLPDTFGHVAQLPQVLRGFGIDTFYAMRGFGLDVEETGSEFWWQAPDGSRVLASWLSESYSNAAVLGEDPAAMSLRHGVLVGYDSLDELLARLALRSRTGALLLLNGGDHLRVQADVPGLVAKLNTSVRTELVLGGLEEYQQLGKLRPQLVIDGELRQGRRHDVFDGIGSTRTPLKAVNQRAEALLCDVAERLDAIAATVDGRSCADSLRFAWQELVKNHAHDSICGCSVDEVHEDMLGRYRTVTRIADAVVQDALARIGSAVTAPAVSGEVPVVVVNPSAHARGGEVTVDVVTDLDAPLGVRRFGWQQQPGVDFTRYRLLDEHGQAVPFTVAPAERVAVADPLNRRKELTLDRIGFHADPVPPLGAATYRLVPGPAQTARVSGTIVGRRALSNGRLDVFVEEDGTVSITDWATGHTFTGLLELVDDGDAGDEYGFGPLSDDQPISSTTTRWTVTGGADSNTLLVSATMTLPAGLTADRRARATGTVPVAVTFVLSLPPDSDRLDVRVVVDNLAEDHRMRLRFPTGVGAGHSLSESAFGVERRNSTGPSAMRRFVAARGQSVGLQVLAEGLHEYACTATGTLAVTMLRSVGWLARTDHPLRSHKVGPQLPTPAAQCAGRQDFRLALRPYQAEESVGALYRAAEEFSVPLLGHAVQSAPDSPLRTVRALLGISLSPEEVVLSAVKSAEDGDGIIVRVVNSHHDSVIATVLSGIDLLDVTRCDLQERPLAPPEPVIDRTVITALRGGEIHTLRLRARR